MPVAITGSPSSGGPGGFSFTVPSDARIILGCMMFGPYTGTVSSMSWGSESLVEGMAAGNGHIWYKMNPKPGIYTFSASISGGYANRLGAICFKGCAKPKFYGSYPRYTTTVSPVVIGDYLVDSYGSGTEENDAYPNHTAWWDDYYDPGSGNRGNTGCQYFQCTTTSGTMTWSGGGMVYYGQAVAHLFKPVGGAGIQVIIESWKRLLDDIRQARIPPELLLRRYREAVQI